MNGGGGCHLMDYYVYSVGRRIIALNPKVEVSRSRLCTVISWVFTVQAVTIARYQ